uniref:2-amino-4-hydroxy-6-hydroxymethyldihydropteridine pyrophosphokinase n=1 Tax=Desulfovibrio sp. U5L TaxID=596152 RepID=I2Q119_9BACT
MARERLAALPGLELAAQSPIYETEPWGDPDQPQFLNQVVALGLDPREWPARRLLAALQAIETALGRVRSERRFGPRTLDLDILAYGGERLDEPDLIVPHPRLRERAFVLVPLADIAPDLELADGQGGSVRQALGKIPFKIAGNTLQTPR